MPTDTVTAQIYIFLWSALAGAVIGALYDALRVSRRVVRTSNAVVVLEDILFFALAAVILFEAAYQSNGGELRWYEFVGAGVGFLLYRLLLSRIVMTVSTAVVEILIKLLTLFLKIVLFPLALIYKLLRKPFGILVWYSKKNAGKVKNILKTKQNQMKLQLKNAKISARKR